MKVTLLALATAGVLGLAATSVEAGDRFYNPRSSAHQSFHDDLDHRDFHRDLYHRAAHRYPMSWGQHDRLHDRLNHDAYHDRLEHRQYHRYIYSPPVQYGCGPRTGISFRFGW